MLLPGGMWAVGGSIYGAQSPEPGTLMMFGSGVLGLAGLLRRKINL
jgi:PEP-CTERM motif-containing protein